MVTIQRIALGCAAAAAFAVSVPAIAEEPSKAVYYQDLDLSSAKGQERLQTRIRSAVNQVCGSQNVVSLAEKMKRLRCKTEAMAAATPKVEQTIANYQGRKRLAANERTAIVGN